MQKRHQPVQYAQPIHYSAPQPQSPPTEIQQAPIYPTGVLEWQSGVRPPPSYATEDLTPSDSVSMVGVGVQAPTVISRAQGPTTYSPHGR